MIKICKFKDCNKKFHANGYCSTHNGQLRQTGKVQKAREYIKSNSNICSFSGCNRNYMAKGFCGTHYMQLKTIGKVSKIKEGSKHNTRGIYGKVCSFPNCHRKHGMEGYCLSHYKQMERNGYCWPFSETKKRRQKMMHKNMFKGGKLTLICEHCKKKYKDWPYVLKEGRKYCSYECSGKARSGENSVLWKGGVSFEPYGIEFDRPLKKKIRIRDNYTCQLCNKTVRKLNERLAVHHIDYDKQNNDESNLISLCNSCHSKTNFYRAYFTLILKNRRISWH